MKDMNVAKLTSQDLLLFNGIMQDLFPGVDTPANDYGKVGRGYNICHHNSTINHILLYIIHYISQIIHIPWSLF